MSTHVKGQDVCVINASPSDASDDRVHVNFNLNFQNVTSTAKTLHTVTSGYTFYLTDLYVTIANSLTTNSVCSIRDDSTVVIPYIADKTITSTTTGYSVIQMRFVEPIPFSTAVKIANTSASAGCTTSVFGAGYEEKNGFKS